MKAKSWNLFAWDEINGLADASLIYKAIYIESAKFIYIMLIDDYFERWLFKQTYATSTILLPIIVLLPSILATRSWLLALFNNIISLMIRRYISVTPHFIPSRYSFIAMPEDWAFCNRCKAWWVIQDDDDIKLGMLYLYKIDDSLYVSIFHAHHSAATRIVALSLIMLLRMALIILSPPERKLLHFHIKTLLIEDGIILCLRTAIYYM